MKNRHIYALLFAAPGFVIALAAAFALTGFGAGAMWLFLFGDASWPTGAKTVLLLLFVLTFAGVWLGCAVLGWIVGKRLEAGHSRIEPGHVWLAAGLTVGGVLLIALHQWGVGNIGPEPDSARCADYCAEQGYTVSSMPPRDTGPATCQCLDTEGKVVLSVPLETVDGAK